MPVVIPARRVISAPRFTFVKNHIISYLVYELVYIEHDQCSRKYIEITGNRKFTEYLPTDTFFLVDMLFGIPGPILLGIVQLLVVQSSDTRICTFWVIVRT